MIDVGNIDKRHVLTCLMLGVKIIAAVVLSGKKSLDRTVRCGNVPDHFDLVLRRYGSGFGLLVLGMCGRCQRKCANKYKSGRSATEVLFDHVSVLTCDPLFCALRFPDVFLTPPSESIQKIVSCAGVRRSYKGRGLPCKISGGETPPFCQRHYGGI